jgi:CRISP-associated protein Cas1
VTGVPGELIAISLAAHHAFCTRRAWLEAAGEHTDTQQMAVGTSSHAAADDPDRSRVHRLHAVEVVSEALGVVGRCDRVELDEDGGLVVVEHKATPVRRRPEVTAPLRLQLALQVLALRDMGHRVAGQAVWFASHRLRVDVPLTEDDFAAARQLVIDTRRTVEAATAPPALEDDPRCPRCSHVAVCLPDERALAPAHRRIVVADPDAQVAHLATPGARASTRGGRLLMSRCGTSLASVPLERVQGLVVHGNVDVSAALLRELLLRGLTIVWCSGQGRVVGWSQPAFSPNGASRVAQHLASATGRLDLAREFVTGKIAGQATLLRRHGNDRSAVARLRTLQRRAGHSQSLSELLGVEGEAAGCYFARFSSLLSPRVQAEGIVFPGRVRRPATDPVNAALNYAYMLLVAEAVRAVVACGLDPHAGFLHSSQRNKPALALDLCEEFRAPVAESAVLTAFNNGELHAGDFAHVLGDVRLREHGRKHLVAAFERRITGTFRHPLFGYLLTWRRALEVQARLVLGVLDGTQPRYVGLRTR